MTELEAISGCTAGLEAISSCTTRARARTSMTKREGNLDIDDKLNPCDR